MNVGDEQQRADLAARRLLSSAIRLSIGRRVRPDPAPYISLHNIPKPISNSEPRMSRRISLAITLPLLSIKNPASVILARLP